MTKRDDANLVKEKLMQNHNGCISILLVKGTNIFSQGSFIVFADLFQLITLKNESM
jgi:hypothetical protein